MSMPTLDIKYPSTKSPKESFDIFTEVLKNDKDLKKLDPQYSCSFDDNSLSGSATGSQFKAAMKVVQQGAGSEVQLKVELPFHLGLVKGMVKKTLEKKLADSLG